MRKIYFHIFCPQAALGKVRDMNTASEQAFRQEQHMKKGFSAPSVFSNTLKAVFSVKGSISYGYRKECKAGLAKGLLVL